MRFQGKHHSSTPPPPPQKKEEMVFTLLLFPLNGRPEFLRVFKMLLLCYLGLRILDFGQFIFHSLLLYDPLFELVLFVMVGDSDFWK